MLTNGRPLAGMLLEIDGHDIAALLTAYHEARQMKDQTHHYRSPYGEGQGCLLHGR